jgi:hypothetical protein
LLREMRMRRVRGVTQARVAKVDGIIDIDVGIQRNLIVFN